MVMWIMIHDKVVKRSKCRRDFGLNQHRKGWRMIENHPAFFDNPKNALYNIFSRGITEIEKLLLVDWSRKNISM